MARITAVAVTAVAATVAGFDVVAAIIFTDGANEIFLKTICFEGCIVCGIVIRKFLFTQGAGSLLASTGQFVGGGNERQWDDIIIIIM